MNYWGGVICGCCAASLFFVVMMFVSVEQTNSLRAEVAQLREEVAEHEEVIRQYEFYVWHNMKFFEEKAHKICHLLKLEVIICQRMFYSIQVL